MLAADVAGYSRLIGAYEEATLHRLSSVRTRVIDPTVAASHGRLIRTRGDGLLIEFASVIDAVHHPTSKLAGFAGAMVAGLLLLVIAAVLALRWRKR